MTGLLTGAPSAAWLLPSAPLPWAPTPFPLLLLSVLWLPLPLPPPMLVKCGSSFSSDLLSCVVWTGESHESSFQCADQGGRADGGNSTGCPSLHDGCTCTMRPLLRECRRMYACSSTGVVEPRTCALVQGAHQLPTWNPSGTLLISCFCARMVYTRPHC